VPSHESVETVARIYEELNSRRVFPPELFASDCVTDWSDVAPDGGVLHGVGATQRGVSQYFETFDEFHVSADVLHAEEHIVVTAVRDGGRMKGSPAEIWSNYFHAWTLRDGKVVRLSSHTDRGNAFKAVGLEDSKGGRTVS
jgi:ketosteroid isomerase-like protein